MYEKHYVDMHNDRSWAEDCDRRVGHPINLGLD